MQVLLLLLTSLALAIPCYAWVLPCRTNDVGRGGCVAARGGAASHQNRRILPLANTRLNLLNC
jgi:hypothetical protein